MRRLTLILASLALASTVVAQNMSDREAAELRVQYSPNWEVSAPPGSALAALIEAYTEPDYLEGIPARDLEDDSPYPLWFRAWLRDQHPYLPDVGPYQYPRAAAQILEWMRAHPSLEPPEPDLTESAAAVRTATVGGNINLTSFAERNSEAFIAVNYRDPMHLVAGANNITGSGRQKQFWSTDGGVSWNATELPLADGASFNSDPALAWTTDGTAWSATLGITANAGGSRLGIQVFRSDDDGASWDFVATVSDGDSNDKELMWTDTHAASPHEDNIYVAWDIPGRGMRFARSTDLGANWSPVMTLSNDSAIGAHLSSGPDGELYVAWPDVNSREIRVRRSDDGGNSFGPTRVIAQTNDAFEMSIPAMCQRKALIYVSVGVDRSGGPRDGHAYVVWADRNGAAADPGCAGITSASNANIYLSRSTDGGTTWSAPAVTHPDLPMTDQFNPWMDVDPEDGTLHLMWNDTRDTTGRLSSHIYYARSVDGGNTWVDETRVTTEPTDETAGGADLGNQYGDYNGLAAFRGIAHPVWTDRRAGVPGNVEQVFSARVDAANPTPAPPPGPTPTPPGPTPPAPGPTPPPPTPTPVVPAVALAPTSISENSAGSDTTLTATVTDAASGAPLGGETVRFRSLDTGVATVNPVQATTDASGRASTTVRTQGDGDTQVEADVQGKTARVPVSVPAASLVALLVLALGFTLWLYRRRHARA